MSKDSVQKFYEFLQQDAALAEELKKAAEGVDSAEKAAAVLIDFAKGKGFEFTAEDIAEFEKENQKELSLEEPDKVNAAGGLFSQKKNERSCHAHVDRGQIRGLTKRKSKHLFV